MSSNIWNGNIQVKNLKLKKNALIDLALPLNVIDSSIGILNVYIPWSKIKSESTIIDVSDVFLNLEILNSDIISEELIKKL